jgi:hypothetical protein
MAFHKKIESTFIHIIGSFIQKPSKTKRYNLKEGISIYDPL